MNNRRLLALSALIGLAVASCGKNEPPPAPKAAPAPLELIVKIGHAAPLTGGIAHLGKDNENVTRLAIEEANAKSVTIDGKNSVIRDGAVASLANAGP